MGLCLSPSLSRNEELTSTTLVPYSAAAKPRVKPESCWRSCSSSCSLLSAKRYTNVDSPRDPHQRMSSTTDNGYVITEHTSKDAVLTIWGGMPACPSPPISIGIIPGNMNGGHPVGKAPGAAIALACGINCISCCMIATWRCCSFTSGPPLALCGKNGLAKPGF
jgi:hypothetical protein